jgi:GT2 family glycosyltransferase
MNYPAASYEVSPGIDFSNRSKLRGIVPREIEMEILPVAAIIVNWNAASDTLECLYSIINSVVIPNKIYIVDNKSDSGDLDKLKSGLALLGYSSIQLLVNDRNLGFGGGVNLAIDLAITNNDSYIWLINNDALVDKKCLSELFISANENDFGIAGSTAHDIIHRDKTINYGIGIVDPIFGRSRHCFPEEKPTYVIGCSMLIRRDVFSTVGKIDDQKFFLYWEDADYCLRARRAGFSIGYVASSIIYHSESKSLGKRSVALAKYFNISAIAYFQKHSHMPFVPITLGFVGRFLKSILRGDFGVALQISKIYYKYIIGQL